MTMWGRRTRTFAACGLLACGALAIAPGCGASNESVVTRYREENSGARIPDITAERLQGCVEEFGGQLEAESNRVEATVQVDAEGRTQGVSVAGVAENDFAACVRVALRDMAVPEMALRRKQAATGQTAPKGNELANPVILWEVGVMLAELLAAHGGKTVLYAVSVEVLSVVAVSGVNVYLKNKKMKACQNHLNDCLATPTNDGRGNNWNEHRCLTCFGICRNTGDWPTSIPFLSGFETCEYWKR